MAKGPEETRLDSWLDGSHEAVVGNGGFDWNQAAELLRHVQMSIERAAAQSAILGGETGPAAARAFARSAEAMGRKADELRAGGAALSTTAHTVAHARQQRREMGPPPDAPVAPEPPAPGAPPTDKDLEKQAAYRSSVSAYQQDQQQREARSKAITSDMDAQYRAATETMKKIHGEPDPVHTTSTTDGSGGGSGTSGGSGGHTRTTAPTSYDGSGSPSGGHSSGLVTSSPTHTSTTHTSTSHTSTSHTSTTPATHGSTSAFPGGNAQSTWSESAPGVPGALAGGTPGTTAPASSVGAGAGITGGAGLMGGLAAGGLGGNLTGGVRGAITPVSSSSAAGVRPIGSAARSGVSGTLGRGATTVGTGSTSGTSGASGRSGGRSGTSSSRGTAGGRGASTGATGRGGDRTRDRSKKSARDHLDEAWEIEDEDTAPPVLD